MTGPLVKEDLVKTDVKTPLPEEKKTAWNLVNHQEEPTKTEEKVKFHSFSFN